MPVATISPSELQSRRGQGLPIELIDVRTPVEFREVHADLARNVPLDALDATAFVAQRNGAGDQPLYVICRGGNRGQQACAKFQAVGYNNVVNVEGGTLAWTAAGLPVVRGQKAMSLERQVRIAAGLLILTGATLGWTVHEAFFGLSAFVGAGLVFAGVTDTCGMGLVLARMPWNQVGKPAETCAVPAPSREVA